MSDKKRWMDKYAWIILVFCPIMVAAVGYFLSSVLMAGVSELIDVEYVAASIGAVLGIFFFFGIGIYEIRD